MVLRRRFASLMIGALAITVEAGLMTGLAGICHAQAQDTDPGQKIVKEVHLSNADLQAAISLVQKDTGVEIVIEPSDKPYGPVNLSLDNRTLDFVLKAMAKSAGASVRYESGVYIIGPKDAVPAKETSPVQNDQTEKTSTPPEETAPVQKHYRVEKIRLQWTRPSQIVAMLDGKDLSDIGNAERVLQYNNLNEMTHPYKESTSAKPPTLQNLNNSSANISDVNGPTVPPVVPTGDSGLTTPGENRAPGHNDEANQFGGGRGGGFGGGGQGRGGPGGGQSAFGPDFAPDTRKIAYDIDNTIILSGPEDQIAQLKEVIRLLDIAPRQLMIKSEFIQVSQNDLSNFGIDWQVAKGNFQASNSGFAGGPVAVNFATGNIAAMLQATLTQGKGKLVSSPMVTTLNNTPVTLMIGREIPVFISSPIAAGNGTVVLQTQLQIVNASSGMFVLPRINGDDSISLFILPFVMDVAGQVTGPDGTTAPILTQETIGPIQRRIHNGETMVIAGLATKNDVYSTSKIPLLSSIPLLGQLFKSNSTTINDTELLVFVTPSIIPEKAGGQGSVGSAGTLHP